MEDILDSVTKEDSLKINYRPFIIWGILILIGLQFKVMHWPGSSLLILVASGGLTSYTICKTLMITKRDNLFFLITSVIGVFWPVVIILGILYNNGYPYNLDGLLFYGAVILIFSVFYCILNFYQLRKLKRK